MRRDEREGGETCRQTEEGVAKGMRVREEERRILWKCSSNLGHFLT